MGFLDDLKKAADGLADGINKAVNAPAGGVAGQSPPPPPGAGWFLDGSAPASWLEPGQLTLRVAGVLGVVPGPAFGPPQPFDRDGLLVARFTSVDGSYTVDVASYTEDLLGTLGGQQGVVDAARAGLTVAEPAGAEFDVGLWGSQGPGHGAFVGCLADAAGRVDVYGPPHDALPALAHALLVDAWRVAG
jgi:hypothetical protein